MFTCHRKLLRARFVDPQMKLLPYLLSRAEVILSWQSENSFATRALCTLAERNVINRRACTKRLPDHLQTNTLEGWVYLANCQNKSVSVCVNIVYID